MKYGLLSLTLTFCMCACDRSGDAVETPIQPKRIATKF